MIALIDDILRQHAAECPDGGDDAVDPLAGSVLEGLDVPGRIGLDGDVGGHPAKHRVNGATAPMVLPGAIDGAAFTEYTTQVLAPTLWPGDIVVMDNLTSHQVPGAIDAVEKAGATAVLLPP